MNADFECAFLKRCLRLDIVCEHFHLVKNFNEKVICKDRKDEQARLSKEGLTGKARALKHFKYILMSCTDTREREELDALEGKLVSRGSALFGKQQVVQKGDSLKHYEDLISQSGDIADEMLAQAYSCTQEQDVRAAMERIRRHVPRPER